MMMLAKLALMVIYLLPLTPAQQSRLAAGPARSLSSGPISELQPPLTPHAPLALPVRRSDSNPNIQALSGLVVDTATGQVLYAKNPAQKLPIASITKLVTVGVILSRHSPEEVMSVPTLSALTAADSGMGLVAGERFTYANLIKAALIPSANDAAEALALSDAGSLAAFSERMNAWCADWQIADAHFVSPNGLVDENNYATALALAKIGRLVLTSPFVASNVASASATITDQAGRSFALTSTNHLLSTDSRVKGLKTGYTPAAGESFMGLADVSGHSIITVVLNSPDRFAETEALINWAQGAYQWQ